MNFYKQIGTAAALAVLAVIAFMPLQAFATGNEDTGIGMRTILISPNAAVGLADDASAIYWNPAGMVGGDRKTPWDIEVGAFYLNVKFYYDAGPYGANSAGNFVIPEFFLTKQLNDRVTVGCGCYTPWAGGGARYSNFLGSPYTLSEYAGWSPPAL